MKKLLIALLGISGIATAAPVTSASALIAVENWLKTNGGAFGETGAASEVIAERDESGKLLWWNVLLNNGGAVIVSADTRIEPIVTVVDNFGDGIPKEHPLRTLLLNDMRGRLAAVEVRDAVSVSPMLVASSGNDPLRASMNKAEAKWQKLGGTPICYNPMLVAAPAIYNGNPARVIGMVDGFEKNGRYTHWNQSWLKSLDGKYSYDPEVYNRLTPKKYVTGCIATCGAAILQCFNVTKDIDSGVYQYFVDGGPISFGPYYPPVPPTPVSVVREDYDWSILPTDLGGTAATPATGKLTNAQKDLLSRVTYHFGLSLPGGMFYVNSETSFSSLVYLTAALRDRYGFKDARYIREALLPTHFDKFIYAQLRAGAPVPVSLSSATGGHQVLAVGYGEDDADTPYTRLFMGWSGKGDAWYNLPDVTPDGEDMGSYNAIDYVTTMLGAKDTKTLALCGRVTGSNGNPIAGAIVSAEGESDITDSNGYWAMRVDCTTVGIGENPIVCTYDGKVWNSVFTVGAAARDKDAGFYDYTADDGITANWYSPQTQQFYNDLPGLINFILDMEAPEVLDPGSAPPGTVKNWPSVDIGVDKAFIAHELTIPFNAPKQVTYEGVAYEDVGGVVTTKGMVTIKVKKSRDVYSVNVKMVGKAGSASLSVKTSEFADIVAFGRSGEKLTATVANDVIVGTLSGGKFGSSCSFGASRMAFADRKDSAAQSKLAHMKGIYNVVLKDDGVFAGYLSLNVGASGKVAVKGKMIDGTSVSFKGMLLDYLNANGWYAVSAYKSLYRKTGGIGGLFWINAATGEVVLDKTGGWALNWSGSDKNGSWNKNLEVVGSKWKGNAAAYDRIVAVPTFEIPHGMVGDWNKEIIWKKPIKVTQHTGAVKDSLTLTFNGAMRDKTFNCSVSGLLFGGGGFAFGTVKVNSTKYPIVVEFKQK